ncbi:MRG-domain-containing protein [Dissoconium aciculare CBS 342.82]|uniref:Chromatin modification-related protein EAF3 n=1 Tax=Dissoconium aciculare CBS 342.82 TaxID=1314786 RepID=A0A6J3ME78_9PEZI|nr:MRG-domain-containing protein [Dissoconium aciculare CBS 342.82]KAF1826310.1 MRG-domain-containing protein [Dissoconium aciculare CBS 342.82]
MAPSLKPVYDKDEKVLCFHGELLYEAKVLDNKIRDPADGKDGFMYRVHYKGWKNTWDDWVPEQRLRKFTPEYKELALNLKRDMEMQRRGKVAPQPPPPSHKRRGEVGDSSVRGSEERSSAAPQAPRGTKRGRELEGIEKEEDFIRRPAVRLFIPDALKSILVDDWEKVTKEQKLVPIPAQTSVSYFLNQYYEAESAVRRPGSADADILEEVIAGVKEYFNKSLGRILLYRFERPQFYNVHKDIESGHGEHAGKTLADMYGCEHLLRLFVSMPDLIAHTNMDSQSVSRLREELAKMTQWLSKRIDKYLSADYEHVGQEYQDLAKSNT